MREHNCIPPLIIALVILIHSSVQAQFTQPGRKQVGMLPNTKEVYPPGPDFIRDGSPGSRINKITPVQVSDVRPEFSKKRMLNLPEEMRGDRVPRKNMISPGSFVPPRLKQFENGTVVLSVFQDWVDTSWRNLSKDSSVYDSHGTLLDHLVFMWTDSGYIDYTRSLYTYDQNGDKLTYLFKDLVGNSLANVRMETWTYDSAGSLTSDLVQNWTGSWTNSSLWTYFKNARGYDTLALFEGWIDNTWKNWAQVYYSYDSSGHILTERQQSWNGGPWHDYVQYTNSYDGQGRLTGGLSQVWNGASWVNSTCDSAAYDNHGNVTAHVYRKWADTVWFLNQAEFFTYDQNGNQIAHLLQATNGTGLENCEIDSSSYDTKGHLLTYLSKGWSDSAWLNLTLDLRSYDGAGKITSDLLQEWADTGWVNSYRSLFSYPQAQVTAVGDSRTAVRQYSLRSNYPNPFNPSTAISYSLEKAGDVKLKIYDVLGREVATLVNGKNEAGDHTVIWNARSVPSGVYFYKITAESYIQTKKMILMK
jgi:hypothetical protein